MCGSGPLRSRAKSTGWLRLIGVSRNWRELLAHGEKAKAYEVVKKREACTRPLLATAANASELRRLKSPAPLRGRTLPGRAASRRPWPSSCRPIRVCAICG